jgi:hypothetical protein
MVLLTNSEYIQRRLNKLSNKISRLTYGASSRIPGRMAAINAALKELVETRRKLNNALQHNRTIMHNNIMKTYQPNYNTNINFNTWMKNVAEAKRYQKLIPQAQALRERILRRRAMEVIRKHWYQPPPKPEQGTGRGYKRHLNASKNRWN